MKQFKDPYLTNIDRWKASGNVRKLIMELADRNCSYHLALMNALEEISDKSVPMLLQVLEIEKENQDLLCKVVDLLALLRVRQAVDSFGRILNLLLENYKVSNTERKLWISCIDGLGRISNPESLKILEEFASDASLEKSLRKRVIEALAFKNSLEVVAVLARLYKSINSAELKLLILSGLSSTGEGGQKFIEQVYAQCNDNLWRYKIIEMLGNNQANSYLDFICDAIDSSDLELKKIALWAIGELGDRHAFAKIKLCFDGFSSEIKFVAANILAKIGWQPGAEEDQDTILYYQLGNYHFEHVIDNEAGLSLVLDLLGFQADALIHFTKNLDDDELWWEVINKLRETDRNEFHEAIDCLINHDQFIPDVMLRLSVLKKQISID